MVRPQHENVRTARVRGVDRRQKRVHEGDERVRSNRAYVSASGLGSTRASNVSKERRLQSALTTTYFSTPRDAGDAGGRRPLGPLALRASAAGRGARGPCPWPRAGTAGPLPHWRPEVRCGTLGRRRARRPPPRRTRARVRRSPGLSTAPAARPLARSFRHAACSAPRKSGCRLTGTPPR